MKNTISNLKITVLSIFVLIVTGSCEDLLKEEPLTQIGTEFFYQNETDALSGLTGAYAQLKSGNGYYRQQWLSNILAASDQGTSSWQHGEFITGNITNTNPILPRSWIEIYAAIRDANNVIANVPLIEGIDTELQNRIVGEARFLRALHYFNLVRTFGEVPLRTEPIKPGDYDGLPVSDVVAIYEVILADLTFAVENCWGREENRNGYNNDLGRATDAAAHALLTKVYLRIASSKRTALTGTIGNTRYLSFPEDIGFYYQKAIDHADEMIVSPGYQLTGTIDEWTGLFDADNGNNPEMIFDIQGSALTEQGTAVSNLFSPRQAGLSGGGWGGVNKFIGRFIINQVDINDPRFTNSIIKEYEDITTTYVLNPASTGYLRTIRTTGESLNPLYVIFTSKYIDRSATTEYTSRQNWHVIRLADVHLMRAEAMAEVNGNPSMANADINLLRSRVDMLAFDGAGMSIEAFRVNILRERAAELSMEGHRFFDLTRMGVYNDYCVLVLNATRGVRDPEDYNWPIPLIESSANEAID